MAKKDIGKILTKGSVKQRLLILAEDNARGIYGLDYLLTDSETKKLSNSFNKASERTKYNQFMRIDSTIRNSLVNLQGLLFEVKMHYSNLRGYILTWNSIENAELLVNSVLHEIKDPVERKRIAEEGAKGIDLLFSQTETDQEGYVDIKVDFEKNNSKEYSLLYVMNNVKKQAETTVIKYLSWYSAILDYMDETGFNVKTYKDILKNMRDEVYSPIIHWDKYYGKLKKTLKNERLEEVVKKYAICPNVEELKVDEVEYNSFKNKIIGADE